MYVYQLAIWREANVPMQEVLDLMLYGYKRSLHTNTLPPELMTQIPAAPELLNESACLCPPSHHDIDCCCLNNDQPCTKACSCNGNVFVDDEPEIISVCTNLLTIFAIQQSEYDDV